MIKLGKYTIYAGFAFWLICNTYFGWNIIPITELEFKCDSYFRLIMVVGFAWYFTPLIDKYENWINNKN